MTFSIRYDGSENEDYSYTEYAVDWDWEVRGKWDSISGIDNKSYNAILKHFGLEKFKKNFPLEKIITTSWEELGKIRRKLEKEYNLPYKEIKSDTLGDDSKVA